MTCGERRLMTVGEVKERYGWIFTAHDDPNYLALAEYGGQLVDDVMPRLCADEDWWERYSIVERPHRFAETGMRWSYCLHCNADAEWSFDKGAFVVV